MKLDQNDDFASMQELVRRRYQKGLKGDPAFLPLPDLIVVDGGYGQVNAVAEQLQELGVAIPMVGLAKKQEELYRPGNPHPLILPRRHEGLKMLQRLRDEAHRFAIEYNRQRRGRRMVKSELDAIPGIGPRRKQMLLEHFGSVKRLKQATLEEITVAPGMNRLLAEKVFHQFHLP